MLLVLLVALSLGAAFPLKDRVDTSYPVGCSRSLATFNVMLGVITYHFYGPINSCMAADFAGFAAQLSPFHFTEVTLYLNSPGGSFSDTLAILDALRLLKQSGTKIIIEASGQVSGSALWIFAFADERWIAPETAVYFERPYNVPQVGSWFRRRPDPASRIWVELLASGLDIPTDEAERLLNERAFFYGRDLVAKGWAKSTADRQVPGAPESP